MSRKSARELVTFEGWFALDLPRDWEWEETDGVISVYAPDGPGAIHFSCLHREKRAAPSADEVLANTQRFVVEQEWEIPRDEITTLKLDGSPATRFETYAQGREAEYWQVWHIVEKRRAVLATYVCDAGDEDEEREVRERVMASFQWDDSDVR